jgi:polygalacturonase
MDSPNLDRALRIKSNAKRGGIIENIFMRNIEVKQVREAAILIDMFYGRETGPNIPMVRNISVDSMNCQKSQYAILIRAYKEQPVTGLSITNSTFHNVEKGVRIVNADKIDFTNSFIYDVNGKKVEVY